MLCSDKVSVIIAPCTPIRARPVANSHPVVAFGRNIVTNGYTLMASSTQANTTDLKAALAHAERLLSRERAGILDVAVTGGGSGLGAAIGRELASAGARVVLARKFSASGFWDEIRKYNITSFNTIGAMIPILMKQPERPDDADNPVRMVNSAACPANLWEAFEKRFNLKIWEAYGAVDGGGVLIFNFGNAPVGSVGKPGPNVQWKLVDDAGHEVAYEEIVKGYEYEKDRYVTFTDDELERIPSDSFHTIDVLQFADGLPKTRSGKIMRRILKKVAANEINDLGDTSTLADPSVVDDLVKNRL